MTEPTIPDYANLLRRAAANHAADASRYASQEQKLTTELGKFEEWMVGEHARIQAELNAAQAKADEELRAISADWETRKRDLAEAGRVKTEHQKHATGAERAWRNWCRDEGIDPADLPPLRDTGPLPAIAAPDDLPRLPNGRVVPPPGEIEFAPEAAPAPLPGDASDAGGALPALDAPEALLAQGRAAADPNGTQVDAPGGGQPVQGGFQGGVAGAPRPRRTQRRTQSDSLTGTEQNGDGRG